MSTNCVDDARKPVLPRNQAREILKSYLPDYLEANGFRLNKGNPCPCCNGGQHKHNVFHYNRKNNTVKCFACGFTGDIFALVCAQYQLGDCRANFREVLEKTADLLGFQLEESPSKASKGVRPVEKKYIRRATGLILPRRQVNQEPEKDYLSYILKAAKNNDYKYLESRGISKAVQKRFLIGMDPEWKNPKTIENWIADGKDPKKLVKSPRCIIPNSRYSYLARDTRSNLTEKQKGFSKQVVGMKRLFNHKALKRSQMIVAVEGEIDALSVIEAGFEAVALCGAANTEKLVEALRGDTLCQGVIIMLDNDEAGQVNSKKLEKGLAEIGVEYVNYQDYKLNRNHDPNAWLCADRNEFTQALGALHKLLEVKLARRSCTPLARQVDRAHQEAENAFTSGRRDEQHEYNQYDFSRT